jgi:hypothetical protein
MTARRIDMTRNRRRPVWTLGLLALAAALPVFAAGGDQPKPNAPQRPNLQGTWKLDEDLTARMREEDRPQGRMGGGFHGGMGRGGGGWGRRGGGGFPGGPRGGEMGGSEGRSRGGPPPSFAALDELTIVQQGDAVTITDRDGHARMLKTDGSKVRDEQAPGGPVELRARWEKDGTLTVKVKPDDGRSRTESYIVSDDGKHLYVTYVIEGGGRDFKIRRAYDPVEETKPAASTPGAS